VHSHGTIREHVTSVNEQRAAIHGPTVLPLGAAVNVQAPMRIRRPKPSDVTFPGMPFRAFPLPREPQ
jgi:hypothetical protein